jgi:hypothetical protein
LGEYQLFHAEVADLPRYVAPDSLDLILTDPPYHKASVPLYGTLAEVAATCLKPGGSLLTMSGQSFLPELFELMTTHLRYQWLLASRLTGPGTAVWARRVQNHWRSWLWLVKGTYRGGFQGDFLKGDGPDKRFHAWGQSRVDVAALVGRFTQPGDLICDPFCGGGTTGKAALLLGRRFVGLDCHPNAIAKTERRLQEVNGADVVQANLLLADSALRVRPCKRCRTDFPPQRSTAEYCSPACRTAAYRERLASQRKPVSVTA